MPDHPTGVGGRTKHITCEDNLCACRSRQGPSDLWQPPELLPARPGVRSLRYIPQSTPDPRRCWGIHRWFPITPPPTATKTKQKTAACFGAGSVPTANPPPTHQAHFKPNRSGVNPVPALKGQHSKKPPTTNFFGAHDSPSASPTKKKKKTTTTTAAASPHDIYVASCPLEADATKKSGTSRAKT